MWPCSKLNSYRTQERRSTMIRPTYIHCTTWSGTRGQNKVGRARSHGIPCDTVLYAAWHGLVPYRHVVCRIPMRTTALRVARCALHVARCTLRVARCTLRVARCVLRVAGSSSSVPPRCALRRSAPQRLQYLRSYPSRAHRATAHATHRGRIPALYSLGSHRQRCRRSIWQRSPCLLHHGRGAHGSNATC
jgi:hypothetical protein